VARFNQAGRTGTGANGGAAQAVAKGKGSTDGGRGGVFNEEEISGNIAGIATT